MSRRTTTITTLEDHPNLAEILGVLAGLAHIRDADLPRLASAWTDGAPVTEARDKALRPDSPLVLEVLGAFEAVSALFDDELRGEAAYVVVTGEVTATALKAVRDAIAASYAQPVLTGAEHAALMGAWRRVYPTSNAKEPDLGPRADQVKALLAVLPTLAAHCHDEQGRRLHEQLVARSFAAESDRADARAEAFQAAVLTSRRRVWALVRRTGTAGLSRSCRNCRPDENERDDERVRTLCLDAACALLVADALPDATTQLLTEPVLWLIPQQRDGSS